MILTNHMSLRTAQIGDANFCLDLRNNDPRAMLSPIQGTVADQRKYILAAKSRTDEDFLIVSTPEGPPVGMVRWTNLTDPVAMGWESLLIGPTAPPAVGIDVMVTTYNYCFRVLQRPLLGPWRVPVWNTRMQDIHQRMGFAQVVDRDKDMLFYAVTAEWFFTSWELWHNRGYGQIR